MCAWIESSLSARLDAVHDDPASAVREVEVEEGAGRVERPLVRGLPAPVELAALGRGDLVVAPPADPGERVEVVGLQLSGRRIRVGHGQNRVAPAPKRPTIEALGVGPVLLVLAGVHVEDAGRGRRRRPRRGGRT